MSSKMKIVIIVVLAGILLAAISAGVWYYKTKFYVPDKDGMVYENSDTVTLSDDSADDGKSQ